MRDRLNVYRARSGGPPVGPVEVIETTETDADTRSHTLPPGQTGDVFRPSGPSAAVRFLANPAPWAPWWVVAVAGVYASNVLLRAAGFERVAGLFLLVGFFHIVLSVATWQAIRTVTRPPAPLPPTE